MIKMNTYEKDFISSFKTFCDNNKNISIKSTETAKNPKKMDLEIQWNNQLICCEVKTFKSPTDRSNEIWKMFSQILGGRKLNEDRTELLNYGFLVPQSTYNYFINELNSRFIFNDLALFSYLYKLKYIFVFDPQNSEIEIKNFPLFKNEDIKFIDK